MGLLALLVSLYFFAGIYLWIHGALSQGPVLPSRLLDRSVRTELDGLVGLGVTCGLIICRYVRKFDEMAGRE
jgi:hypothetical protein